MDQGGANEPLLATPQPLLTTDVESTEPATHFDPKTGLPVDQNSQQNILVPPAVVTRAPGGVVTPPEGDPTAPTPPSGGAPPVGAPSWPPRDRFALSGRSYKAGEYRKENADGTKRTSEENEYWHRYLTTSSCCCPFIVLDPDARDMQQKAQAKKLGSVICGGGTGAVVGCILGAQMGSAGLTGVVAGAPIGMIAAPLCCAFCHSCCKETSPPAVAVTRTVVTAAVVVRQDPKPRISTPIYDRQLVVGIPEVVDVQTTNTKATVRVYVPCRKLIRSWTTVNQYLTVMPVLSVEDAGVLVDQQAAADGDLACFTVTNNEVVGGTRYRFLLVFEITRLPNHTPMNFFLKVQQKPSSSICFCCDAGRGPTYISLPRQLVCYPTPYIGTYDPSPFRGTVQNAKLVMSPQFTVMYNMTLKYSNNPLEEGQAPIVSCNVLQTFYVENDLTLWKDSEGALDMAELRERAGNMASNTLALPQYQTIAGQHLLCRELETKYGTTINHMDRWSHTPLPQGFSLNARTGKIHGTCARKTMIDAEKLLKSLAKQKPSLDFISIIIHMNQGYPLELAMRVKLAMVFVQGPGGDDYEYVSFMILHPVVAWLLSLREHIRDCVYGYLFDVFEREFYSVTDMITVFNKYDTSPDERKAKIDEALKEFGVRVRHRPFLRHEIFTLCARERPDDYGTSSEMIASGAASSDDVRDDKSIPKDTKSSMYGNMNSKSQSKSEIKTKTKTKTKGTKGGGSGGGYFTQKQKMPKLIQQAAPGTGGRVLGIADVSTHGNADASGPDSGFDSDSAIPGPVPIPKPAPLAYFTWPRPKDLPTDMSSLMYKHDVCREWIRYVKSIIQSLFKTCTDDPDDLHINDAPSPARDEILLALRSIARFKVRSIPGQAAKMYSRRFREKGILLGKGAGAGAGASAGAGAGAGAGAIAGGNEEDVENFYLFEALSALNEKVVQREEKTKAPEMTAFDREITEETMRKIFREELGKSLSKKEVERLQNQRIKKGGNDKETNQLLQNILTGQAEIQFDISKISEKQEARDICSDQESDDDY